MNLKRLLAVVGGLAVVMAAGLVAIVSSYDYNRFKPMIEEIVREATGRELTLGGDIHLDIGLVPALVVKDVAFRNAAWGSRKNLVTVRHFEVEVAVIPLVRGQIDVKRVVLVEPDILVETDGAGRSNLAFHTGKKGKKEKAAPKPAAGKEAAGEMGLPNVAMGRVSVEKGRFTFRDGETGKQWTAGIEHFNLEAEGPESPVAMEFSGEWNGKPFRLSGTLGALRAMVAPDRRWDLNLSAKASGVSADVEGGIRDLLNGRGIELKVRSRIHSLPEAGKLADVSPLPDPGAVSVDFLLSDPAPGRWKIDPFSVTFGESDLSGNMGIDLSGKRPGVELALNSEKLDLRPILAPVAGPPPAGSGLTGGEGFKTPGEGESRKGRVFPDDPLPLSGLTAVDAKLRLRARRVILPRIALQDLSVDVSLANGRLVADPVKAVVGGGRMAGKLTLASKGRTAVVDTVLAVDGLDLEKVLMELGKGDIAEGYVDAEVAFSGRGGSVAGIMAGLSGKSRIVMAEGRLNSGYLDILGGNLAGGILKILNPLAAADKYTDVNCLVSGFVVREGQAEVTALLLDTGAMSVVGDGTIDLGRERLDISLKPSAKEGAGDFTLSLGELAKPFRLGGTFAKPKVGVDTQESALALGKALGGAALMGPAGILAAFTAKGDGAADVDLCLAAREASEKGVKLATVVKSKAQAAKTQASPEKKRAGADKASQEKAQEEKVREAAKQVEKLFKGLFNN